MQALKECTVEGNNIKPPSRQLDRKEYLDLKKALEGIGGKWKGGKVAAFQFDVDPTNLFNKLIGGDKINLKKDFQAFFTPQKLADYVVSKANLKNGNIVCEPSAGQGAFIEALNRLPIKLRIVAIELMETNSIVLREKRFHHTKGDFLKLPLKPIFDNIIANPPFSKNQDIIHIKRMYDLIKPGGQVVCIMSTGWAYNSNKVAKDFRKWLGVEPYYTESQVRAMMNNIGEEHLFSKESVDGFDETVVIEPIPERAFKESGTNVRTVLITINKS